MSHRLQLFDTPESLGEAVAAFLYEGYLAGEQLVLIAKPRHRDAVFAALQQRGCFAPEMDGPQRLVALHPVEVLNHLTRNGKIDPALFQKTVRPLVETLARKGTLRIYGEVVELLAEEDNLEAAADLEELWNDLSAEIPMTLMCGYSSAHFARPTAQRLLRDICRSHTHVMASDDDTLGNYLLAHT